MRQNQPRVVRRQKDGTLDGPEPDPEASDVPEAPDDPRAPPAGDGPLNSA